jgi:hypothetical protein
MARTRMARVSTTQQAPARPAAVTPTLPRGLTRPLPTATHQTLVRLRFVARTLDRAAARMRLDSDAEGIVRMMAGNVWHAIDRIEDLAMIVEELAPPPDAAPEAEGPPLFPSGRALCADPPPARDLGA